MDGFWFVRTLVLVCLKELVAVMFILTAYNRLGTYTDLMTGPLLLFLTLVVFAFPFLNSYLFVFLRFGPWYQPTHLLRSAVQAVLVCASQVVGAVCAAALQTGVLKDRYGDAHMAPLGSLANGTLGALYVDTKRNMGGAESFFEEGCAVFVLLVGLMHCIEADAGALVVWKYWADPPSSSHLGARFLGAEGGGQNAVRLRPLPARNAAQGGGIGEAVVDDEISQRGNSGDTAPLVQSKEPVVLTPPHPVPVGLILHSSLVVAGIVRAFPSAHQSLHITIFVGGALVDGGFPDLFWARIGGGIVATALALGYYHCVYRWAGTVGWNPLKRLVVDYKGGPVFIESELALPRHMKV